MQIQFLSVLIGTVLPLLVGVVTTRTTDAGVKATLLAALSAVSGFLTEWLTALNTAQNFDWGSVALTALATFITGVGLHFGFLKPAGVSQFVQDSIGRTGGKG